MCQEREVVIGAIGDEDIPFQWAFILVKNNTLFIDVNPLEACERNIQLSAALWHSGINTSITIDGPFQVILCHNQEMDGHPKVTLSQ